MYVKGLEPLKALYSYLLLSIYYTLPQWLQLIATGTETLVCSSVQQNCQYFCKAFEYPHVNTSPSFIREHNTHQPVNTVSVGSFHNNPSLPFICLQGKPNTYSLGITDTGPATHQADKAGTEEVHIRADCNSDVRDSTAQIPALIFKS